MTAYVEECRQEWKRLRVPDRLAEEMATELETDLAEAEADGVSAAEMLGESDPRRFAATWARERGLVAEHPPPKKSRKRFWIVLAVCLFILVAFLALVAGGLLATTSVSTSGPVVESPSPRPRITVPNVIGMRACPAERVALAAGLIVRHVPSRRCGARVVGQWPAPGRMVPQPRGPRYTVRLRLRRARR